MNDAKRVADLEAAFELVTGQRHHARRLLAFVQKAVREAIRSVTGQ